MRLWTLLYGSWWQRAGLVALLLYLGIGWFLVDLVRRNERR